MSRTLIKRAKADAILRGNGWLSVQPEDFQDEVLRLSILLQFAPGEVVFRQGDEPGGIYGLVDGTVSINTAPPDRIPSLIHIGVPGAWTGEGSFLTRQPRRLELRALTETWMMHLPLDQMDRLAVNNPEVVRRFSQILIASVDVLIHIVHDLQKLDPACRIAAVLHRMSRKGDTPVPLSQSDLGAMAAASRRQVSLAFRRFTRQGWVRTGYRSIHILDGEALRRFASGGDD